MTVKIKLFGSLRRVAGYSTIDVSAVTVRGALAAICGRNSELTSAIFDGDNLQPHVRVMVNGHDIELLEGLDTAVKDSDQIAIFPPISGG